MFEASVASGSLSELRSRLEDGPTRTRLAEVLYLGDLLQKCIIDRNYKVTDQLVSPINLTALGDELVSGVKRDRPRLKPNEVKLATFLRFGCSDGLLVDASTDVDALRREVSKDILAGKILFPYIFGRELHDLAARVFPEATSLNVSQTVKLLRELPKGVFQEGYTTVGPYGAVMSDAPRLLGPTRSVPGYLCSDPTCTTVHTIQLSTAEDAAIHKAQDAVEAYLERHNSRGEDRHTRLVGEAVVQAYGLFQSRTSDNFIETLADDFSTDELRVVASRAIRAHFRQSGPTEIGRRISAVIQDPDDFVSSVDRASLLQILLIFTDDVLVEAVDLALADGSLCLPEHEVRVRRLSRFDAARPALAAEVGSQGVRFVDDGESALVARRLLELLHSLYFDSGALEPGDLAYLLDEQAQGISPEELLDHAVRILPPERILRNLVLSSRRASLEAARFLGVSIVPGATRDDLLSVYLWKLGLPSPTRFTDFERVSRFEEELLGAVGGAEPAPEELIRGHISNLFTSVEDALQRSLEFTTWALTEDHFLAVDGHLYDPAPNTAVLDFLDLHAPVADLALTLKRDGRNTLAPLASGFARLGKALQRAGSADHLRPIEQHPLISRSTSRPFAFPSTLPFYNLSLAGQDELLRAFKEVTRLIGSETVLKVRNASMHGNNQFPTSGEINLAVESVAKCRSLMIQIGAYPRVFNLRHLTRDVLARREYLYLSGSDEIVLHSPGWAIAPGLPIGSPQLVIMPAAVMTSSGPLRFTLKPRPGRDPYWEDWPKRWRVETHYASSEDLAVDSGAVPMVG